MDKRLYTLLWFISLILIAIPAMAVEGEVYIGQYDANLSRGSPDGGVGKYVAGVEINEPLGRFNPYIRIETILDEYVGNGTFHPMSVRYDLGIEIDLWKGLMFEFEHSCWHPVDIGGTVESYNLYKIKYRFK